MKSDADFNENEMRKELAKFLAPLYGSDHHYKMKEMPRMPWQNRQKKLPYLIAS